MNNLMSYVPKVVLLVVYKSKNGSWRGFCNPYDVTCEGDKLKETMNKLEKLVGLYREGLQKYGYPKHLSLKKLSNKEDLVVFEIVKKKLANQYASKRFLEDLASKQKEEKNKFTLNDVLDASRVSGYYYQPTALMCQ